MIRWRETGWDHVIMVERRGWDSWFMGSHCRWLDLPGFYLVNYNIDMNELIFLTKISDLLCQWWMFHNRDSYVFIFPAFKMVSYDFFLCFWILFSSRFLSYSYVFMFQHFSCLGSKEGERKILNPQSFITFETKNPETWSRASLYVDLKQKEVYMPLFYCLSRVHVAKMVEQNKFHSQILRP
jgi:hypothetical protein